MVDVLDEPNAFLLDPHPAVVLAQRLDRETGTERAIVANGLPNELEDLGEEPRPVLERSPVLVRAPVEVRQQELLGDRDRFRAVDQDQVKPGVSRALGSSYIEALKLTYVVPVHLVARARD